ncbi:probable serine/threonine-protein kinase samkC [Rhipicephalus sanguineus]|uniref:probable serine/threonine-protein kinase samkC n=1 Tax=Rhipicephalus sanguineus TaxID=34632 RepID=UPI001894AF7F|nr:probable serine/threonine-protein kinase samkC [Rhipicephalus sanguineus]
MTFSDVAHLLAGSALSRLSPPEEDGNAPSSDEAQRVEKSPPVDEQAQENTKRSEATGKLQEKNSPDSQNFSRERSSRHQHSKRKAKKHGAATLNTTNTSAANRKSKRSAPAKSATALLSPSHVTPMDVAAAPPTQPAPPDNEKTEPSDAKELPEVKSGGNANDPSIRELRDAVVRPASSGSQCALPQPRHQADKTAVPAQSDTCTRERSALDKPEKATSGMKTEAKPKQDL